MNNNSSFLYTVDGGLKKGIKNNRLDTSSPLPHNKDDGGNDNMNNDKYVTHEELELSNEKLLHHIDNRFNDMSKNIDNRFNKIELDLNSVKSETKFANAKINWILGILSAVIGGTLVALITSLLK
ncbi:hypothetical protein FP435_04820 [Lactobacillus sp. PV037]|uniref:hypothetical protein n=1 Tax=Lactobacillus sp. PV037 TaxID=2594496 RepID=UPI002240111E|nr:hypothetical protein [Lactobacillus sp. PV037]QNQ83814.1 hypothetical protein FP435_04820 [Lactobacillus sp. PV037]